MKFRLHASPCVYTATIVRFAGCSESRRIDVLACVLHCTLSDVTPSPAVGSGDLVTGSPCYSDVFKHELHEGLLLHVSLSVRPSYRKEFDDFYCINFEAINPLNTELNPICQ